MSLRLRIDDYPGTKPEEFVRHNLRNYKMFHEVLKKHMSSYTLGVIPGYTMLKDMMWLAEQPEIVVAMHGIVHNESHPDEFRRMTYRDIETAIHQTKDSLEATLNTRVVDYIPPHNTINPDTILALSRLGFERIYGGPETLEESQRHIRQSGMEYIHSEPPLEYGRSDELMQRGSIDHLKRCGDHDIWLTLHWTWEINIGLEYLELYFSQIGDLFK